MTDIKSSATRHPLATAKVALEFNSLMNPAKKDIEYFEVPARYEVTGPIARGSFGFVGRAIDQELKAQIDTQNYGPDDVVPDGSVAIKKVPFLFCRGERMYLCAVRELNLMLSFDHPNIVNAKDLFIPLGAHNNLTLQGIEVRRQMYDEIYIVMDFMDQTLRQLMDQQEAVAIDEVDENAMDLKLSHSGSFTSVKPLTMEGRAYILFQLLCGLDYLHKCGVVHRDLKPDNLLIDAWWTTRVCDFGQARAVDGSLMKANELGEGDETEESSPISETLSDCCTQWYASPESLTLTRFATTSTAMKAETMHSADIWAVGCIAAEMLLGRTLFGCKSRGGVMQFSMICSVLGTPNDAEIATLSRDEEMEKAIRETLNLNQFGPNKLMEVLRSPLSDDSTASPADMQHERELIAGMLHWDPAKRLTTSQALQSPLFATYTVPEVPCAPIRFIRKEEVAEAQQARDWIWRSYCKKHPEVDQLIEALGAPPSAMQTPAPAAQAQFPPPPQ